MNWLMLQKLDHREQRIAFEELLDAVRQDSERVELLEQAIREAVPEWSLAEVVTALQAMRGIDLIAAVTVLAEIGDLSRSQTPRELMGYLGPRALRALHRGDCQARRHHQGWQQARAPHPGRSRLELPASSTCQPQEAAKGERDAERRARDRVESANSVVRTLPVADQERQAPECRHHGHCSRAVNFHLGDQSRGHAVHHGKGNPRAFCVADPWSMPDLRQG